MRRRPRALSEAVTIADLRAIAQRRLPNVVFEYLEGGAEEETTLRRNRSVLRALRFRPRVLTDVAVRDLAVEILGARSALPVVVAPTGGQGLFWPRGDLAMAAAAAAAGIPMGQSTVSTARIEDVAATPSLDHWFQLYYFAGDHVADALLERAAASGSRVLLLTADGILPGNREWDRRNHDRSGNLSWRSRLDVLCHPRWLLGNYLIPGEPTFENLVPFQDHPRPTMARIGSWIRRNEARITWDTVRRLRARWGGKLVIKGLLHVDDVRIARDLGADGVVLSNHGGRQCEPTISPVEILPQVRAAVGRDFTILVDSGFRRGSDVVAARALGADAVLIGRAALYGLAAGGRAGVAAALDILTSEIDRTLALIGVDAVRRLSPACLDLEASSSTGAAGRS
ncbi:alpha-hydroxy-acid oxidizing protein [Methylobacterium nonmethylotrophicum]|uniref:Alpha-hydroxy-acid oxidizing protein n=2 Tax=Methylobacterium nonmethylotrophicum TaxID=1141884 RepID=A0A4Z0NXS7_9HYPH|nr:alpha-hydroxy-acid oxidizing protein [Methylobacterium nonmethylotrophicum]